MNNICIYVCMSNFSSSITISYDMDLTFRGDLLWKITNPRILNGWMHTTNICLRTSKKIYNLGD